MVLHCCAGLVRNPLLGSQGDVGITLSEFKGVLRQDACKYGQMGLVGCKPIQSPKFPASLVFLLKN